MVACYDKRMKKFKEKAASDFPERPPEKPERTLKSMAGKLLYGIFGCGIGCFLAMVFYVLFALALPSFYNPTADLAILLASLIFGIWFAECIGRREVGKKFNKGSFGFRYLRPVLFVLFLLSPAAFFFWVPMSAAGIIISTRR